MNSKMRVVASGYKLVGLERPNKTSKAWTPSVAMPFGEGANASLSASPGALAQRDAHLSRKWGRTDTPRFFSLPRQIWSNRYFEVPFLPCTTRRGRDGDGSTRVLDSHTVVQLTPGLISPYHLLRTLPLYCLRFNHLRLSSYSLLLPSSYLIFQNAYTHDV